MNISATGHINPTLPLVAELRARSCDVTYFVEGTMRSVVEAAGASWLPYRNPYDDDTGPPKSLHPSGIAKYVPEGTPCEEYLDVPSGLLHTAEILLPALIQDLRKLQPRPSLIVNDPFLAFGPVAGHVLGVPVAAMLTMAGPGRLFDTDKVIDQWESKPWVDGPRREVLLNYGFDMLKRSVLRGFYSPTLNLVTTIDQFYTAPWPGRQQQRFGSFPFRCVGVLADPLVKRVTNANLKQEGGQYLDLRTLDVAIGAGQRVLYISLGTVASSKVFWARAFGFAGKTTGLEDCTGKQLTQHVFRACFEAFGSSGKDAALVILALGPQEDVLEGFPPTPPNFVLRKAVPQMEVLQRCSAFITHGGANSMHEALSLGVPMAVVPLFGDQPMNAESLEACGAAISFHRPMESVTPASLSAALGRLLEPDHEKNPFRAAACRMAQKLQDARNIPTATDALLEAAA